jgi:hypothetical protein
MRRRRITSSVLGIAIVVSGFAYLACTDGSSAVKEGPPTSTTPGIDAGGSQVGIDGGSSEKDCFDNPKTHFEIINACTKATRIVKNPTLNRISPDGGLPPTS